MLVNTFLGDNELFLKTNHFNNHDKWLPKSTKVLMWKIYKFVRKLFTCLSVTGQFQKQYAVE